MFDVIGYCKVSDNPQKSIYPWGDLSEIASCSLRVIERNSRGDCLCITEKGIVDVDNSDIENFQEKIEQANVNFTDAFRNYFDVLLRTR